MRIVIIIFWGLFFNSVTSSCQVSLGISDSTSVRKDFKPTYKVLVGDNDNYAEKAINKTSLLAQVGIYCECINCDNNHAPCKVKSFSIIIISNNETLFFNNYKGDLFDMGLKEQFGKLKKGDLVVFHNIMIRNVLYDLKAGSFVYEIK